MYKFSRILLTLSVALLALACTTTTQPQKYHATVSRTEGGIPHITTEDWGSLGFATGYVQSEDNVCVLAQQYLKFGAQRSRYSPEDPKAWNSDFFYQLLIDRGDAEAAVPEKLEAMFAGAAAGYNHYLTETGVANIPDPNCRGAAWVQPTTALGVKRVSSVDYALDYMLDMITSAQPPVDEQAQHSPMSDLDIVPAVEEYLEVPKQGGSNAIAIGAEGAQSATSLLVANPHMPWNEPFQRFYPMHHIIPGELNMLGANLLGRPRVGFGTTEQVAWTSTVSTAKRFSFYQLQLVDGNSTQYIFDGKNYDMVRETVSVNGRTHTFYSTHFDALLVQSPFFDWSDKSAVAVRMHNVGLRGESSTFEQYRVKSVAELKAVHNKYQFLSVNLIAADNKGDVMYTDPGPVPYLSNEQLQDCAAMHGAALDGSRSECQWQSDDSAVSAGILPPSELPLIYRRDYVTNSNDSYWLANPEQPLEGFLDILGNESSNRTLRTRSGLDMVQRYLAGKDGDNEIGITLDELLELTLSNEHYAGQLVRDDLVGFCRQQSSVKVDGTTVDLTDACKVLSEWDLHADLDSQGAHLLRQTLAGANNKKFRRFLPPGFTARVPFDVRSPLQTPRGLAASSRTHVLEALGKAVLELEAADLPLNAKLGDVQGTTSNGEYIPIHGGQEIEGIFNKIEASFQGSKGYPEVNGSSSSWIMGTEFTHKGPRSRGILTYSLSANPESPWYSDQTKMYSEKKWLDLPFSPEAVSAAALQTYTVESR
jgi:acyl-homoserine-lactone acylase